MISNNVLKGKVCVMGWKMGEKYHILPIRGEA